jgi:DNA invertase Pin-like site-specific DNA recombinase
VKVSDRRHQSVAIEQSGPTKRAGTTAMLNIVRETIDIAAEIQDVLLVARLRAGRERNRNGGIQRVGRKKFGASDDQEAQVVRRILSMRLNDGMKYQAIADELNDD